MKRLEALDWLRALAVLLVVVTHSIAGLPIGGVGVSIFFVLSGYLITTLLLRERADIGRISIVCPSPHLCVGKVRLIPPRHR
jgi:peptidoglycan/LPS O-acetylase OafA/YrhL